MTAEIEHLNGSDGVRAFTEDARREGRLALDTEFVWERTYSPVPCLLQLERIWLLADGRRVAHRRCPECGTRDSVTVGAFAMKLWLAREERLRGELSETAAELAGGAEVPIGLT